MEQNGTYPESYVKGLEKENRNIKDSYDRLKAALEDAVSAKIMNPEEWVKENYRAIKWDIEDMAIACKQYHAYVSGQVKEIKLPDTEAIHDLLYSFNYTMEDKEFGIIKNVIDKLIEETKRLNGIK